MTGDPLGGLQFPDSIYGAGRRVGVAVSGGSDSLALLHLLKERVAADLIAVTVNHGLRREAASEALHVERICEGLGVPHRILAWQGWDGTGNLQDQARRSRYDMIADWAEAEGAAAVALGHTLDDQAETVLMRLSRVAGVDGLSGMAAKVTLSGMRFHRPLLGVRRDVLRVYLTSRRVRWVDDPSNADEAFERVRARQALEALEPMGLSPEALAGVAGNLRAASTALSVWAGQWAREHAKVAAGDVILDRTAFSALPGEMRYRLMSSALRWVARRDYPPRREAVLGVLAGTNGNTTLHGCLVMPSAMSLRIAREPAAVADAATPTEALWDGRWRLSGPHAPDLEIRRLGDGLHQCPGWRETGLPRLSLTASPAIWRGETLVSAPVAGFEEGWRAETGGLEEFCAFLISH